MNRLELSQRYWDYYQSIESQFEETLQYVAVDINVTFKTYSNRYASLLQVIGSELDSAFKEYCGFVQNEHRTIADYATSILSTDSDIVSQQVEFRGASITLVPFAGWDANRAKQSLAWWKAFDSIKHSRASCPELANLENVLNSLSALYLMDW